MMPYYPQPNGLVKCILKALLRAFIISEIVDQCDTVLPQRFLATIQTSTGQMLYCVIMRRAAIAVGFPSTARPIDALLALSKGLLRLLTVTQP